MGADLTEGGTTGSPDTFSRFEWVKNKRYQSFTLSASPASQTVGQGGATTFTTTVTGQGNFNGAVSLVATGLPAGATASFSPATITGGGTSTLTVQTSGSTPVGTYPLTITATALGTVGQNAGVKGCEHAVPHGDQCRRIEWAGDAGSGCAVLGKAVAVGVDFAGWRDVDDAGKRVDHDGDVGHRGPCGDGARQHAAEYEHV